MGKLAPFSQRLRSWIVGQFVKADKLLKIACSFDIFNFLAFRARVHVQLAAHAYLWGGIKDTLRHTYIIPFFLIVTYFPVINLSYSEMTLIFVYYQLGNDGKKIDISFCGWHDI